MQVTLQSGRFLPGAISPHAIAVAVTIVTAGTGPDVGGRHFASSERHDISPLIKFIYANRQAVRSCL